jgi:hypothetical protein
MNVAILACAARVLACARSYPQGHDTWVSRPTRPWPPDPSLIAGQSVLIHGVILRWLPLRIAVRRGARHASLPLTRGPQPQEPHHRNSASDADLGPAGTGSSIHDGSTNSGSGSGLGAGSGPGSTSATMGSGSGADSGSGTSAGAEASV